MNNVEHGLFNIRYKHCLIITIRFYHKDGRERATIVFLYIRSIDHVLVTYIFGQPRSSQEYYWLRKVFSIPNFFNHCVVISNIGQTRSFHSHYWSTTVLSHKVLLDYRFSYTKSVVHFHFLQNIFQQLSFNEKFGKTTLFLCPIVLNYGVFVPNKGQPRPFFKHLNKIARRRSFHA